MMSHHFKFATMAKLADAPALGAGPARGGGSTPSGRISTNRTWFGLINIVEV